MHQGSLVVGPWAQGPYYDQFRVLGFRDSGFRVLGLRALGFSVLVLGSIWVYRV